MQDKGCNDTQVSPATLRTESPNSNITGLNHSAPGVCKATNGTGRNGIWMEKTLSGQGGPKYPTKQNPAQTGTKDRGNGEGGKNKKLKDVRTLVSIAFDKSSEIGGPTRAILRLIDKEPENDREEGNRKILEQMVLILEKIKARANNMPNMSTTIKEGTMVLERAVKFVLGTPSNAKKRKISEERSGSGTPKKVCYASVRTEPPGEQETIEAEDGADMESVLNQQLDKVVQEKGLSTESEWQTAGHRKGKRRVSEGTRQPGTPRARRFGVGPRGDSIVVKCDKGKTYAEVLAKLKGSTCDPGAHNVQVNGCGPTANGNLKIRLGRKRGNVEQFVKDIQAALGDEGTVRETHRMVSLEVKDLDELTTKTEIEAAVKQEAGAVEQMQVHIFETNTYGQRAAVVDLDSGAAEKLLKKGRLKVGWTSCRLRVRVKPKRCYKCLGYGHLKVKCTGEDRSTNCWKCGEKGHQSKACQVKQEHIECYLCRGTEGEDTNHAAGSGRCSVYKNALGALIRQQR